MIRITNLFNIIFISILCGIILGNFGLQWNSCASLRIGITSNGNLNRFGWFYTITLKLSILNLNRKTQSNECSSLQYTMERLSYFRQTAVKYIPT